MRGRIENIFPLFQTLHFQLCYSHIDNSKL
nr:MAG TPA_asm: hypothetical protein [Caudoviricetes sp.]